MNSVAFIAFTQRGCALAAQLAAGLKELAGYATTSTCVYGPGRFTDNPYGNLTVWTAEHFKSDDVLVFVGAAGIAVRAIAPHVNDKFSDPAVVSIDEAGCIAVPLLSGHVGGANDLARVLAGISGGEAAISTATDVNEVFAVDEWAARNGLQVVEREFAKEISARLLEGGVVGCAAVEGAPSPSFAGVVPYGAKECPADLGFVVSWDAGWSPFERTLHLVPQAVTVGVGCRKGVAPKVLASAVDAALAAAKVSPLAVCALATIDVKRGEPAIETLATERGWDLRYYPAEELRGVPGEFDGSAFVEQTVGVDNVCERAALAEGGILLLGKQAGDGVTVAVSAVGAKGSKGSAPCGCSAQDDKDAQPGSLAVVGLGPGGAADLTGRARAALDACDVIVGYPVYIDLIRADYPEKPVLTTPMRQEVERCRMALEQASAGRRVALVCSGDPGVYGMAGLVLELASSYSNVDIQVVPGVSAANGGAAVLGAPLMHDWCAISLSDALTPWETIERRLAAAAQADFAIVLYNPSSHKRPDYLRRACDVLLTHKDAGCVCGIVRNIGREGQESRVLTLGELRDVPVDMFTTVFVGTARTRNLDGRMVTSRGYRMGKD